MQDHAAPHGTPSPRRDWKSIKRQRQMILQIRVTPTERALLLARAAHAEITLPAYVRETVLRLSPPPPPRVSRFDREALAQVRAELVENVVAVNRVGSNVNQIARVLNSDGQVMFEDLVQAMQATVSVSNNTNRLIQEIRAAMNKKAYAP